MRSHTPGPWVASKRRPGDWDIETNDADIAEVHGFGYSDEGESDANARLIAAAPELLEALKEIECFTEGESEDDPLSHICAVARAAIAKATGATT